MCGIAGVYELTGESASRAVLCAMAGALRHRGPDGTGLYQDGAFGMVNTRLSIVDLSGGDQPISNEDGRYWVMQNGEIYNFPELREQLEALGHRFRTSCDTEVIVHAFEQWGAACLDHFNGAFALAVWDRVSRELFLARDRLGIRPLFLAEAGGALLFGSEQKALFQHPALSPQIDPSGLVESLTVWGTAPDRSAFRGVVELAPGHYMRVGPGGVIERRRWWDIDFAAPRRTESAEVLAEELLDLLTDSTRLRLRADVPVGAYLSGGLDSSATASIVRRISEHELFSFSVVFADPRFDERTYQQRMASELRTELHTIEIDGPKIAGAFPEVVRLAEKPLLRTAPAPMLLLSKSVRDFGLKVVLTGEGADEMFAGYNIFRENKVRRFWARQPNSQIRPLLLRRLYPYLARDLGRAEAFTRAFFGKNLTQTDDPLYSHRIRFENGRRCVRFLTSAVVDEAATKGTPEERLVNRLPAGFSSFSPLDQAQYLEIATFLQGYLLHSQGDRMLMGNAIEGRFPFLDHRLAEVAARIPDRMRIAALREKHLLRQAVAPLLPKEVLERDKRPYRAPIAGAFFGPNRPEYVADLLSEASVARAGLFQPAAVNSLVTKCRRSPSSLGETDEMALVGILSTMLLHHQFVEQSVKETPLNPTKAVVGAELAT